MADTPTTADTSVSFLAWLLAALDVTYDDPRVPNAKVDRIVTVGPKVIAHLVVATGDTYRVTVEWLSEESP
jgi:hypothetical protein